MSGEKLLEAVRHAHAGVRVWLLALENEEEAAARVNAASDGAQLMPKEKEVFALVLKRRTNAARSTGEIYISLYTVKNRVSSILRKFDLKSRSAIS